MRAIYKGERSCSPYWQAIWGQADHIKDICSSCWVSCVFSANKPPQVSSIVLRPCLPGDLLQKSCSASTVTVVFRYVEINRAKEETSPCFRTTSPIDRGVKAPSVKAEKERKCQQHTATNAPLTLCLSVSWMLPGAHTQRAVLAGSQIFLAKSFNCYFKNHMTWCLLSVPLLIWSV